MNKLTAIIIAKNEEDMIADCIDSVSFADEIVIVDSGSKDKTREIAKRMAAKVYDIDTDDFSAMRNFGRQKATGEWILYVDADERVSVELKKNILSLISHQSYVVYKLKRKNFYFGDHPWPTIEYLERLFKKESLIGWKGKLHETPTYKGEIGDIDGYLMHFTHRNLSQMIKKTLKWSKIEAQLRVDAHHPPMKWWRFPRVMWGAFFNSYITQKGWKAGTMGLIESMYQAFSIFITYARLWEMQEKIKKNEK